MDPQVQPQQSQTVPQAPVTPPKQESLSTDAMPQVPVPQSATPESKPEVAPPVDVEITPQPIANQQISITGPGKEYSPAPIAAPADIVRPSEVEPVLAQEVTEAGVTVVGNPEQPQLTTDHTAIGIAPAKDAVPVRTSPVGHVQLPMEEKEAKHAMKTQPIHASVRWFATLIVEQYDRAKRLITKSTP